MNLRIEKRASCRVGNIIAAFGTALMKNGETAFVGNVYGQTKYCLELLINNIEEAGGKISCIIRTRIMLIVLYAEVLAKASYA
ncbi:MAG: hypothetical protein AAF512_07090 [Pseudomonadota bacterium]